MADYKALTFQIARETRYLFQLIFNTLEINKFSDLPELKPVPDTMFYAAYRLARVYHYKQVDKAGEDYILHPLKIAKEFTPHNDYQTVAILHDILEDTTCNIFELKKAGIPQELIMSVVALTRAQSTDYFQYIRDLCSDKWALAIKLADLYHNTDVSRLKEITVWDYKRMIKYKKALEIILQYLLAQKPICSYRLEIRRYSYSQEFESREAIKTELSRYFTEKEQGLVNKLLDFRQAKFDNTGIAVNSYRDFAVYAYK